MRYHDFPQEPYPLPGYGPPPPRHRSEPPPPPFGGYPPPPPPSGYQGYFDDQGYPPPPPQHLDHRDYEYQYDHYGCSSFLRGCLTALCCCFALEQCCWCCY